MTAHRSLMLAVFLTVASFVGRPVAADPVLDFTNGNATPSGNDVTVGWKFTVGVGSPIVVGGLGVFDIGANGLAEDHQIALWKSDASLLASATIKADGSNSTPVASTSSLGDWRSTPITPLALLPGDYVVGAFYKANTADYIVYQATASNLKVTWDESRYTFGSSFVFPSLHYAPDDAAYFGPNLFTVATPPVPEPTSLILLGSGLAGLAGRFAWRKRRPK